jgi:hypothetical protein
MKFSATIFQPAFLNPNAGILAALGISTLPLIRSVSAKQVTVSYFDPTVKIKGIRLDQKTRW